MINKKLLQERFKKGLKTYNENSTVQNKMADKLVQMIDIAPEDILEIGCGTGVLTNKIVELIGFKNYHATDIVLECKNYIENISKKIYFFQSDVENYVFDKKYDLIISNATFQWIDNLPEFISKLKHQLKPNGVLIFSTFGEQNFKEINLVTNKGLDYYSIEELKSIIQPSYIEEEILELSFKSPKEVLKHIKNTGVNSINSDSWTKSDLINFEKKYQEISPDIKLTYHAIYIKQ